MIIKLSRKARQRGNILLIGLLIAVAIGVALASYLQLVENESQSVTRSQQWNQALVVAEAGAEDGLAFVNKFAGTYTNLNDQTWATTYAEDNWQKSNNVYWVTRYMDASTSIYYTVYVTNLATGPVVRSTGYVPAPVWLTNSPPLSRTLEVGTRADTYFNVAMAALGAIDLKGNNVATDSFDSSATNYPGYWTSAIRGAEGDVVTDNTITNTDLSVGNANVAGHVKTGPSGHLDIGPNGSVGDLPWVDSSTKGVKPGWYANDFNIEFKDVTIPSVGWLPAAAIGGTGGSSVAPDGNTYAHVFIDPIVNSQKFYTISDSGDIYVGTNINVILWIKKSVGTFAPNHLYVAGAGSNSGSMLAYVDCANCTLGTSDKPQSGLASSMAFLGTPNCTSLKYSGNGDFTGVMYMPEADFQLSGGGSGIIDFIGSSVTRTVQMNGHYHFHYDVALKKWTPDGAYMATSWREL